MPINFSEYSCGYHFAKSRIRMSARLAFQFTIVLSYLAFSPSPIKGGGVSIISRHSSAIARAPRNRELYTKRDINVGSLSSHRYNVRYDGLPFCLQNARRVPPFATCSNIFSQIARSGLDTGLPSFEDCFPFMRCFISPLVSTVLCNSPPGYVVMNQDSL